MKVNISLERLYAGNIYSFCSLCQELNALVKFMNNIGTTRYLHDDLMDSQNLWDNGLISTKAILILSKNFLYFMSNTIEN